MSDVETFQRMYRDLKAKDGQITLGTFLKEYGENQKPRLAKAFGSGYWSKLVELCGDTSRTFSTPKSDFQKILDDYGLLSREVGKLAVSSDWSHKGLKPTTGGIRDGHGINFGQIPDIFLEEREGKEEWADVIGWIKAKRPSKSSAPLPPAEFTKNGSAKFQSVLKAIKEWLPDAHHNSEGEYRIDLRKFLESKKYSVRYEMGDSLIDLLVDDKVAVEVKKSPTTSEYDRLFGQIARHCDSYGEVIAVVCAVGTGDIFNDFDKRLDKWLRKSAVIELVRKG